MEKWENKEKMAESLESTHAGNVQKPTCKWMIGKSIIDQWI